MGCDGLRFALPTIRKPPAEWLKPAREVGTKFDLQYGLSGCTLDRVRALSGMGLAQISNFNLKNLIF